MKKVVFLDVDGVLNDVGRGGPRFLVVEYVENLKRVVDSTGAIVVVSSSWRDDGSLMGELRLCLSSHGIEIHSATVGLNKAESIFGWMESHLSDGEFFRYAVVDDCGDLEADFREDFILANPLDSPCADRIVAHLNEGGM